MVYEGYSVRKIKNWKFLFCYYIGFYVMIMGRMYVDLRFILYWNFKILFVLNKKSLFDMFVRFYWLMNMKFC